MPLLVLLLACGEPAPKESGPATADDTAPDTASTDCTSGGVTPATDAVEDWHWVGEAEPTWTVALTTGAVCVGLQAESDVDWLRAGVEAGELRLEGDVAALPSGEHVASVSIRDGGSDALATVSVTVRALHEPTGAATRHALVVGVDGLDGEELTRLDTPVLDLLRRHALWTDSAQTQLTGETVSGPGWTSVLTGVEVSKHGVTENDGYSERDPSWETFIARLAGAGIESGVAFQWLDLFLIVESGTYMEAVGGDMAMVTDGMERMLGSAAHQLYMAHLDDVDAAGHAGGFSADNPGYVKAVSAVEASIERFLTAIVRRPEVAEENWLVVVTSDHGGSGTSHGCTTADCQTIPLIVAGARVEPGVIGTGSHLDVHPTLLKFYGLDPGAWDLDGVARLAPREDRCDDGLDGDGDGATDCDDEECAEDLGCRACELTDLGSGSTQVEVSYTTSEWAGTCDGDDGAEAHYTWSAPTAGIWVFTTEDGDEDTTVYLLDGSCDGGEIGCGEDVPGLDGRGALAARLEAGTVLTVRVDSDEEVGDGTTLDILGPPTSCPDATLDGDTLTVSGDLPEPVTGIFDGCATAYGPVLYAWTAPATGTWRFDTVGSEGDTVLYLLDGCEGASLACNDDSSGLQSVIEADLEAGQEVVVAVGSFGGRTRSYVLNIGAG